MRYELKGKNHQFSQNLFSSLKFFYNHLSDAQKVATDLNLDILCESDEDFSKNVLKRSDCREYLVKCGFKDDEILTQALEKFCN